MAELPFNISINKATETLVLPTSQSRVINIPPNDYLDRGAIGGIVMMLTSLLASDKLKNACTPIAADLIDVLANHVDMSNPVIRQGNEVAFARIAHESLNFATFDIGDVFDRSNGWSERYLESGFTKLPGGDKDFWGSIPWLSYIHSAPGQELDFNFHPWMNIVNSSADELAKEMKRAGFAAEDIRAHLDRAVDGRLLNFWNIAAAAAKPLDFPQVNASEEAVPASTNRGAAEYDKDTARVYLMQYLSRLMLAVSSMASLGLCMDEALPYDKNVQRVSQLINVYVRQFRIQAWKELNMVVPYAEDLNADATWLGKIKSVTDLLRYMIEDPVNTLGSVQIANVALVATPEEIQARRGYDSAR